MTDKNRASDLNARLHETALRIARELGMGGIGIVSIEASRDAANRLVEAADELTTSRATCARLQEEVTMNAETVRREVRDKLQVFASADKSFPLQKAIVQKQCEDFLVDLFAAQVSTLTADMERHIERANKEIGRREQVQIAVTLSEQKRLQLIDQKETLTAALRRYGRHEANCKTRRCVNCDQYEWLHDAAEDLDEVTCLQRGETFLAETTCTCGLDTALCAASEGAP